MAAMMRTRKLELASDERAVCSWDVGSVRNANAGKCDSAGQGKRRVLNAGAITRAAVQSKPIKRDREGVEMSAKAHALRGTLGVLIIVLTAVLASAQTKTISVAAYGAKCNGRTDDTSAFQAASTAASSSYRVGQPAVVVRYTGTCLLAGSVLVKSGVHWQGDGQIRVVSQPKTPPAGAPHLTPSVYPTFFAINADDVEWDKVDISIETPGPDHPYASGIGWFAFGDSSRHSHVKVTNCRVSNFAWGIDVFYNDRESSGSLTDVEIANNTVTSLVTPPAVYSNQNWDGIHVAGNITDVSIHDNTVTHRGDAAIALTSESSDKILSQAKIQNNKVLNDRIGIDISGVHDVDVSGNFVQSTYPDQHWGLLAYRQIYYNGVYPVGIHTHDNHFESGQGSAGFTAKIDPASGGPSWPALNSTFENNTIAGPMNPLYLRGSGITVEGNTFNNGGQLFIDYFAKGSRIASSNIRIGTNRWLGDAEVRVAADSSLIKNVTVAPQTATGTTKITNDRNVRRVPK